VSCAVDYLRTGSEELQRLVIEDDRAVIVLGKVAQQADQMIYQRPDAATAVSNFATPKRFGLDRTDRRRTCQKPGQEHEDVFIFGRDANRDTDIGSIRQAPLIF
jgi:hypothetical protein